MTSRPTARPPAPHRRIQERFDRARELNLRARPGEAAREFRSLIADLATATSAAGGDAALVEIEVRSWLGLAAAEFALDGDLGGALDTIARAERAAERDATSRNRWTALALGQRGFLHRRSGQPEEALTLLTAAIDVAGRLDPRDLASQHLNRGSTLVDLGRFDAALPDYEAARRYAVAAESPTLEAFAQHNIGWLLHITGDLPGALHAMSQPSVALDQAGAVSKLGRAEVLAEVGLVAEAELLLGEAIPVLGAAGRRSDQGEAEYFHARCLLALLRFEEAGRSAARAARRFDRAENAPWSALARVLELESALAPARGQAQVSRRAARQRAAQAVAIARDGDAAGPVLGQHPGHAARLVAARWFLLAGDLDQARSLLAELPRGLTSAPLTMRLQHYTAQAELAFATGDRSRGLRAVRSGLSLLADHRSKLGSVESVTAAAAHGMDLTLVDVEAAARTERPAALFDALERGRATFAGAGRVTPPDDPEAAALLTEARGLLSRARELGATEARERERLTRRARRLQDEVRERSWRHAGNADDVQRPVTAREVRGALSERGDDTTVLASFLVLDGTLRCVRVDSGGVTTIDVGPAAGVTERVRRLGADFAMAANHLIPVPLRAAARSSLDRNLKVLDETLMGPLGAHGDLYVVAREPLLRVPWTLLPSRSGLRTAVNSYVARGRAPARPTGGRRLLAAAGPRVRHGADEARAVGRQWPGATVLTGDRAITDQVRAALASHDVVHLATHGQHDADNPLFASIDLADGPLFAHELDGTPLPGSVVILSACEVGGSSQVLGGELLGLTSVLLRLGARAVIASVAKLSDELAARVMPVLHAHLRDTDDPEAALAAALADVGEPVPLVCFSSVEGLAGT